jgi:hypothetical protein
MSRSGLSSTVYCLPCGMNGGLVPVILPIWAVRGGDKSWL